jgi:hypothetical protein
MTASHPALSRSTREKSCAPDILTCLRSRVDILPSALIAMLTTTYGRIAYRFYPACYFNPLISLLKNWETSPKPGGGTFKGNAVRDFKGQDFSSVETHMSHGLRQT